MNFNKFSTLLFSVAMGVGFMLAAENAEARNSDTYRNLLMKKTYTIKYVDITPEPRITNKDKIQFYGKNDMDRSQSVFLTNKQTESVAVADGVDSYEEIASGAFTQCRLQKGSDVFLFVKYNDGKKQEVYGNKKGSVAAVDRNYIANAMQGATYGSSRMSRYLNALLPDDGKSADMPSFRYIGAGWLDNGLNYEDYKSDEKDMFEAVRYYFNGYNLVKIAAVQYWTNSAGVMEGNKTIIKINEFSPTPDKAYLELPAGVKVKAKKK
ncbi:MAG: hypothetical protein Q4E64_05895 [Phascolarctobacterium sp.]|uniref:hypothetical protein n=1 Tax=Phascolarctobacterium sp. TaxID=2049039 RepID=UPI0026DAA519|nr:hypothetical protein [Phascolarctobacterium sp.]MDO4921336.1 hypothetical protein [Phascolarctobacterium sp.]